MLTKSLLQKEKEFLFGDLSKKIIELAIKVHKKLGPGFVEKIYGKALLFEFKKEHIKFETEEIIKVEYEGVLLGNQRIDFLIEDKIILELKAVTELNNIHQAQILSYLKAAKKKVGLLLNFAKPCLEIKRIVN